MILFLTECLPYGYENYGIPNIMKMSLISLINSEKESVYLMMLLKMDYMVFSPIFKMIEKLKHVHPWLHQNNSKD